MSYFNNPLTEEELKEQYRELLKTIDYHNPQNAKLIKDMRKEYEENLMKIKRANGYRTPLEKVADYARSYAKKEKEYSESVKAAKVAEKERIERLKNHIYTEEELIENFNKVKYYLGLIIDEISKKDIYRMEIINGINRLDNASFYQWFNARDAFFPEIELRNKYDSFRELLEYAILSISEQTKISDSKIFFKIEDTLGEYFKEYYKECCDKYVDPIELAEDVLKSHIYGKPSYAIQKARVTQREKYEQADDTARAIFHSLRYIRKLLGF